MRDLGSDFLGVVECRRQRRPKKAADLVITLEQRAHALADIVYRPCGIE
jgi:hypothetical protein